MHDIHALNIVCPSCGAINRALEAKLVAGAHPNCGSCHKPLFSGEPHEIASPADLDRHIVNDQIPIVVDFWAEWCGPCRMMAPHFARAAKQLEPRVRLLKVDTDEHQILAGRYRIRGVPTLILFHGGREVARHSGMIEANSLERWMKAELSSKV